MTGIAASNGDRLRFSVGRVLSDTFSSFFSNFTKFMLLGIAAYAPPIFIWDETADYRVILLARQVLRGDNVTTPLVFSYVVGVVTLIGTFALIAFTTACIIYGSIETIRYNRVGFRAMILKATNVFVPVILATLLLYVMAAIGLVVFVIPGVILILMLSATIPLIVDEQKNPIEAMRQSRDLTRGHRFEILGGFLVCDALMVIVFFIVVFALVLFGPTAVEIGLVTFAAAFGSLISCFLAAAYVNLRLAKDGTGIR